MVSVISLLCVSRYILTNWTGSGQTAMSGHHNTRIQHPVEQYEFDLSEVELSSDELEDIKTKNRTVDTENNENNFMASDNVHNSHRNTTESHYSDILRQKFRRPRHIWQVNTMWQLVNSTAEIYLYTAHYDDRPGLDSPAVRVISVAEADITNVYCVLWYTNTDDGLVIRADVIPIGPRIAPNLTIWYEQFFLSCNVSQIQGAPAAVSIIVQDNLHISNLVRVHVPERPSQQMEFGHCMSVIYWKLDAYRVIEWLELHKMWGVSEVNIYSHAIDDVTKAILQHYVDEGFVVWRQTHVVFNDASEATILLNMSPVINDCYYRNMYRYKRVVCTDFDEMIVPRLHNNYSSMIQAIDREKQRNHTAPSYMFRNVYFFTDFPPVTSEPWYLLSTRYLRHIAVSDYGYSVKSITDSGACIALQNHLCWKRVHKHDSVGWTVDVNKDIAMNQHYKKCHFDEFLGEIGVCQKTTSVSYLDRTMLRFQQQLSQVMVTKLKELNLMLAVT